MTEHEHEFYCVDPQCSAAPPEPSRPDAYIGPIQHSPGKGAGACDCWCARCEGLAAPEGLPLEVDMVATALYRANIGCEGHGSDTRHLVSDHKEDAENLLDIVARLSESGSPTPPLGVIDHDHVQQRRYVSDCEACRHNLTAPLSGPSPSGEERP